MTSDCLYGTLVDAIQYVRPHRSVYLDTKMIYTMICSGVRGRDKIVHMRVKIVRSITQVPVIQLMSSGYHLQAMSE
jgi:hypothetical protein